jgi:hypothetical protein
MEASSESARTSVTPLRSQDPQRKPVPVTHSERTDEVPKHGGAKRSAAPKGTANGNYQHGIFTCEAIERQRAFRKLIRQAKITLARLERWAQACPSGRNVRLIPVS